MTHAEPSTAQPNNLSVAKRILIGAGIGLILISVFLSGVHDADPSWGKYWMIRPLILVPFAGAMAGLCNYIIMSYRHLAGAGRVVAVIVSLLVSLVGLWMGFVLGLDGTLWN